MIKLKEQLTLKDALKMAYIDYDGVEEAIIEMAKTSSTVNEFFDKFDDYFSEHGLGGDDCHMDTINLLELFVEGN